MKKIFLVVLFLFSTACAKPQILSEPYYPNEQIYNATFEETWLTTLKVLTSFNARVKTMDKSSGFIVTEPVNVAAILYGQDNPTAIGMVGLGSATADYTLFIERITDKTPSSGHEGAHLSQHSGGLVSTKIKIIGNYKYLQVYPQQWVMLSPEYHKNKPEAYLLKNIGINLDASKKGKVGIQKMKDNIITEIGKNSPAEKAGLNINDIILKIDDKPFSKDPYENFYQITGEPESIVNITVLRDNKEITFIIKRELIP